MKIALCYYGLSHNLNNIQNSNAYNLPVNYLKAFQSHKENLIDPNNMDVFIHSWSHENIGDIVDKYKPKKSLFEQQIDFYKKADKINSDPNVWGYSQRHHILSRWYSNKKVLELKQQYEKENQFTYDLVMVTRFDCVYNGNWNLSELDPTRFYVTGGWGGNYETELPDLWFISNSENMDILSKMYDELGFIFKEYPNTAFWGGHLLIKKYLHCTGLSEKIQYYKQHHIDSDILRG